MMDLKPMRLAYFLNAASLCLLFMGCGGSSVSKTSLQDAQAFYDKAMELDQKGQFVEAAAEMEKGLAGGGLNPDQLSEAYLIRARGLAVSGKTDLAEKDVESAERGAPNAVSLHFTRAILLMKKGSTAESKAEFAKATKLNSKLKMPQ